MDRVLKSGNVYTHKWQMGDLVLYDNTQMIHRREAFDGLRWLKSIDIYATSDYFSVPEGYAVGRHPAALFGQQSA